MESWIDEAGNSISIDERALIRAMEHLGGIPALEDFRDDLCHMTEHDVLSVRAEHGLWSAIDLPSSPDGASEVGCFIAWRSDAHPVAGSNPCWVAAVSFGYPPSGSSWDLGWTEEVLEVAVPAGDDDDAAMMEAYSLLCELAGEYGEF